MTNKYQLPSHYSNYSLEGIYERLNSKLDDLNLINSTKNTFKKILFDEFIKEKDTACLVWCVADIIRTAAEKDIIVTEVQAKEILRLVIHNDAIYDSYYVAIDVITDIVLAEAEKKAA